MTVRRIRVTAISQLLIVTALVLSIVVQARAGTCPPGVFPAVSTNPASVDPQTGLTGDFVTPIMDANALQKYVNPLPNPLAPGFIYTPAGSQGGETWYTVSQRQISQGIGLIYNNPANPADPNNGCTAPPANFWVYGDARDNGLGGSAPTAAHTYPSATFEVSANTPTRVTWTNELPSTHIIKVDPTLDCGPNAPNCFPYNRTVPHVHGAHVADDSDGNPDAWFTPNFLTNGHNWKPNTYGPTGTYRYENSQEAATLWYHDHAMGLTHQNAYVGLAGFYIVRDANEQALQGVVGAAPPVLPKYPYEVPIVIQDKVLDITGQPITPDKPLQDMNTTLAAGTPCDPTVGALAPYACTGSNAILPAGTACDPLAAIGTTYACPTVKFRADATRPGAIIPDPLGTLTAPTITPEFFGNVMLVNGQAWPKLDVEPRVYRLRLLNGSDSRTYVMRLMVKDPTTGALSAAPAGLDLWQIGTEQALLNNPVKPMVNDPTVAVLPTTPPYPQTNAIVLMPGERVDLLVDFKKATPGSTIVLQNMGPDAPYTGEYPDALNLNGQAPTVLVPEIMAFKVTQALDATTTALGMPAAADTLDPALIGTAGQRGLRAAPITPLTESVTAGSTTKKLYLAERMGPYGRFMLTINGKDYMQAIDELTNLNDVETWEIYNLTPDGHPMHLHLVAFQVINRQGLLNAVGGVATNPPTPYTPLVPPLFARPPVNTLVDPTTYALDPANITGPAPNELNAWKDTIFMAPGTVTRVRAKFDIPGLYVYHCHILSHEENDMMRPFAVTTPASSVILAQSTTGTAQPSGSAAPVTFTAAALTGIAAYPESNAFEYSFTVTSPSNVVTPLDNMGMFVMGTTPGYSPVRTATWTPPKVPGTYVITVNAKAMGPVSASNPVRTASLNYTVSAPAIAGATSTTPAGSYMAGSVINTTVTFNQAISSTGLTISLNNGAVITTGPLSQATSFSGTFTVAAGQDTPAGQHLNITGIAGTITDAANNSVSTLSVPAGANIADNVSIVTDTVAPLSQTLTPAGTYSGTVNIILSANEPAQIHYTTDGTTPNVNSPIYVLPIPLSSATTSTVTVKFFAVDTAGNVETTVNSAAYTLHVADLTANVAINNGNGYTNTTNVTVALSASDKLGVAAYAISTDNVTYLPTVAINPAVPVFSAKVPVTLPTGDGLKTVYVKFTDALGVVYPPVSAQIYLETALPVVAVTPAGGDYAGPVTVSLSTPNEFETAIIYYTTNGSTPTTRSPLYKGPFTVRGPGSKVVKFFAVDLAGNVGTVQTVTYNFVANPDMIATVTVNNGAVYTNTRNVTLQVSAADPIGGGVGTMAFSNDGITYTAPVPYAATTAMPWVLPAGDGLKTVYFRFTDKGTTAVAPITYTFTAKIVLAEGVQLTTGDVNGDGKVDLTDALKAIKASAGHLKLTIAEQARGDVGPIVAGKPSPDGKIDTGDALVILKKAIGLIKF